MILVDSTVWIDYFNDLSTPQTEKLNSLLDVEPLFIGDIILTEVLQGFRSDQSFHEAKRLLTALDVVDLGGQEIAIQAARNYRILRTYGVTIRKTIDSIIATRCIEDSFSLLHNDKDFDPFEKYLGLIVVSC